MEKVFGFLKFTTETHEDFSNGYLPTLDTQLRVTEANLVEYIYFEKPTTSEVTVLKKSALEENAKTRVLVNDLGHRFLNCGVDCSAETRAWVLDGYAKKLVSSGYGVDQVRRILVAGLRGF